MSKVCYKFDLTDPDDREEFLRTTKATDMAGALWDIAYNSKKSAEYEIDYRISKGDDAVQPYDVINYIYDQIFRILDEHNIDIDQLYR
jgi:hypothetical protein